MTKKAALILFVAAVLLTLLLYLIDSDPPYESLMATLLEATIITLIIYGMLLAFYSFYKWITRQL